jgi:hypothetical protein
MGGVLMVRLHAAALAVLALLAAGPAQALVIDPTTGGSGSFFWTDGVGDSVSFGIIPTGNDTLEITLAQDSTFSLFAVTDCCIVGDSFSLVVDGVQTNWSSFGPDGDGGLFEARRSDLFLSAGTHTIDLTVATAAPGFNTGSGFWSMSAAIPEPSSALLACAGALALRGFFRRRRLNP